MTTKKRRSAKEREAFERFFKRNERWGFQDVADSLEGEIKAAMFLAFQSGRRAASRLKEKTK